MSDSLVGILEEVRRLIQNDDLKSAGVVLLHISNNVPNRFKNEILVYKSSIKQLFDDQRKGIVNSEHSTVRKRQLMFSVLDLLDEIVDGLTAKERKGLLASTDNINTHTQDTEKIIFESSIGQVIIQSSLEGNNTVDSQQKSFSISGIGGSVDISAPVAIADTIENSFNQISEADVSDDLKSLLEKLLSTINEINKTVPSEQSETAQAMARDAESLVSEATSSNPRRAWYELSIKGLKEAATSIGAIALPVLTVVEKVSALL